MTKTETRRLLAIGDARRLTNAPGGWGQPEPQFPLEYDM